MDRTGYLLERGRGYSSVTGFFHCGDTRIHYELVVQDNLIPRTPAVIFCHGMAAENRQNKHLVEENERGLIIPMTYISDKGGYNEL